MNTEVIIIIVVAVLVLLAVVAFFVLKKEKFSVTQQPTAHEVIEAAISNIKNSIRNIENTGVSNPSYLLSYFLSYSLYITTYYVSNNIYAINKEIADNKASSALTQDNNLFRSSLWSIQGLETTVASTFGQQYTNSLVDISNNLFIIYFNIRLYEENNNAKINTNTQDHIFNKEYNDFLTIFPNFPILLEIIKPNQVELLQKLIA